MTDVRLKLLGLVNEQNPHLQPELTFDNVVLSPPRSFSVTRYNADTTFTVTGNITYNAEVYGASGGSGGSADYSVGRTSVARSSGRGGHGAKVIGTITLNPGDTVRIIRGNRGLGGLGGNLPTDGTSGTRTEIRVNNVTVITADGGGGGGRGSNSSLFNITQGEDAQPPGGVRGGAASFPTRDGVDRNGNAWGSGTHGHAGINGYVVLSEVIPDIGDRNTAINLKGILNRGYKNSTDVYYKRHDLNALFVGIPKPKFRDRNMDVSHILDRLNNRYGLHLEMIDFDDLDFGVFTDEDLETSRDIELKVKDTSYGWIGTVTIELRYGNPLIDSVVIVQLLPILEHPDDPIELNGRLSGTLSTWAFDFTAWKKDLNINPQNGQWLNFATVQEIGQKAGLTFWYNSRVIDLPTSMVSDANPSFERVMIQNTIQGGVKGPLYFHYDLNW